jgi:hypothetical protein
MGTKDPYQERKRLTELYSDMNDAQLEEVAEDWASLTEEARQVLQDEITRRGQSIVLEDSPILTDDAELRKLVTIREFTDMPEALAADPAGDGEAPKRARRS